MLSDVCRFCGCTEQRPCVIDLANDIFCAWADAEQTVCSACVGRLDDGELEAIAGPQLAAVALQPFPLMVPTAALPVLSDCLKLVLRHPEVAANEPDTCEFCRVLIGVIDDEFSDMPASPNGCGVTAGARSRAGRSRPTARQLHRRAH